MNFIIFREAIYSYINSGINMHSVRQWWIQIFWRGRKTRYQFTLGAPP